MTKKIPAKRISVPASVGFSANLLETLKILSATKDKLDELDGTQVSYDNSSSGLTADDLQSAIDELDNILDNLDGTQVSYDNSSSGLTASDLQSAIDELKTITDGFNKFNYDGIRYHTQFPNTDDFAAINSDGSLPNAINYLIINSGSTSGDIQDIYKPIRYPVGANTNWSYDRYFSTSFYTSDNTSQEIHIVTGDADNDYIGFRVVDDTLYGVVVQGANEETVQLKTGIAFQVQYLELRYYGSPNVEDYKLAEFYVNDSKLGEIDSDTATFPAGTSFANDLIFYRVQTNTNAEREIEVSELYFYQKSEGTGIDQE